MNLSNADKALVLTQALPYMQKYFDKTVVIQYDPALQQGGVYEAVMSDIVLLGAVGIHAVLVHGGASLPETMGQDNKSLVASLQAQGGRAIGLCGIDGGMIAVEQNGEEGRVARIDPSILLDLIGSGYIPVVAAVGCGADGDACALNPDAAASAVASCLHAENLIMLSQARGVLKDKTDESSLISAIQVSAVPSLLRSGTVTDGMRSKVEYCVEAVRRGVKKTFIIDGRIPHSILIEMFSDEGIGTMLY